MLSSESNKISRTSKVMSPGRALVTDLRILHSQKQTTPVPRLCSALSIANCAHEACRDFIDDIKAASGGWFPSSRRKTWPGVISSQLCRTSRDIAKQSPRFFFFAMTVAGPAPPWLFRLLRMVGSLLCSLASNYASIDRTA